LTYSTLAQLLNHIERFNWFPEFQSAYREYHSIQTAMSKIQYDLILSKGKGECAVLTLLDLSAAFGHDILLNDLDELGSTGIVLNWSKSYLNDREFKVGCYWE